jgi:hypothetical protein
VDVLDGNGPKVSGKPRKQFSVRDRRCGRDKVRRGGRHSAVKIVAGAVGANERAIRNWFEAKNGPSGEHLLRLISHSDEMLDSVLAMAGKRKFGAALDIAKAKPALERALAELAKLEIAAADPSLLDAINT